MLNDGNEDVSNIKKNSNKSIGYRRFSDVDEDVDYYYKKNTLLENNEVQDIPGDDEFNTILRDMMSGEEELSSVSDIMGYEASALTNRIIVPDDLMFDYSYTGFVYGFYRRETGCHVVLGWEGHMAPKELGATCIGFIECESALLKKQDDIIRNTIGNRECVVGKRTGKILSFYEGIFNNEKNAIQIVCKLSVSTYSLVKNLFSRNAGLLETDWMQETCVVIAGCGSAGSLIAIQLAKSGVGKFVLVDDDILEISNVCRHLCNLKDVGRLKVDAVKEQILCVNPYATVICFNQKIQDISSSFLDLTWAQPKKTIFIGTCDNRFSNALVCDLAYEWGIPFACLGFNERAWGGEIFTCLPEKHDVCYRCVFKNMVESSVEDNRRDHEYINAQDSNVTFFEPGLDIDIQFGVSLFNKVVLDIINRNNENYSPRIFHKITQYVLFSGTDNKPEGFWKKLFTEPISIKNVTIKDSLRRCKNCVL